MSDKLKNTIGWATFIIILIVSIFGVVIPFLLVLYVPLFLPKVNISSLMDWGQRASSIMGFTSIFLAIYSIWQAFQGNKEFQQILETVKDIRKDQEIYYSMRNSNEYSSNILKTPKDEKWNPDRSK